MFTGLLTGLRTARKCQRELAALQEWCQDAAKAIKRLQERCQEIESAHHKLRGKVYGEQSVRPERVEGGSREARKAAAFAKLGIRPGQPTRLEN